MGLYEEEIRPVSAWTSAETPDVRTLDKVYDGDWTTHAVFLDDSRDGNSDKVHPIKGSAPVTATIIFDLGKICVSGVRMVAPIVGITRCGHQDACRFLEVLL